MNALESAQKYDCVYIFQHMGYLGLSRSKRVFKWTIRSSFDKMISKLYKE